MQAAGSSIYERDILDHPRPPKSTNQAPLARESDRVRGRRPVIGPVWRSGGRLGYSCCIYYCREHDAKKSMEQGAEESNISSNEHRI